MTDATPTDSTGTHSFFEDVRCELHSAWAPVATTSELPRVGDFRTRRLFDLSVVVLRTKEHFAVYRNSCPHEGYPLLGPETAGHAAILVCPWHSWAFSLEGTFRPMRLRGPSPNPPRPRRPDFDLAALGAIESNGVIWSCAGPPASALPQLDPPFVSNAPPARLRVPVGWRTPLRRGEDLGGWPLGPGAVVVPVERGGRYLVTVSPRGRADTALISWLDPGTAPMPYGAAQVDFLRQLAGIRPVDDI